MPGPLAAAFAPVLAGFAKWLAGFRGSWLFMGIFALIAEIIPRLLGLGQGLISWGFGVAASAAFSAFQMSLSLAGVSLPSFSELLSGLPPGIVWAGSALHFDKVVYILVSIPLVKLLRKVLEGVVGSASKGSAASLMKGGR
jgi:hypothetical protein